MTVSGCSLRQFTQESDPVRPFACAIVRFHPVVELPHTPVRTSASRSDCRSRDLRRSSERCRTKSSPRSYRRSLLRFWQVLGRTTRLRRSFIRSDRRRRSDVEQCLVSRSKSVHDASSSLSENPSVNPLFETVWYTYTSCGRTPSNVHYIPLPPETSPQSDRPARRDTPDGTTETDDETSPDSVRANTPGRAGDSPRQHRQPEAALSPRDGVLRHDIHVQSRSAACSAATNHCKPILRVYPSRAEVSRWMGHTQWRQWR